jgi:prophage regulatory protein
MSEKHERFLRLTAVQRRVPFSRSNLYLMMSRGEFPQPILLGARAVAWLESEIDSWIEAKVIEGRAEAGIQPLIAKSDLESFLTRCEMEPQADRGFKQG